MFLVVGLESWDLCLLCRHAVSELHLQPPLLCTHWAPMGAPVLYPPQQVDDVIIVCKGERGEPDDLDAGPQTFAICPHVLMDMARTLTHYSKGRRAKHFI